MFSVKNPTFNIFSPGRNSRDLPISPALLCHSLSYSEKCSVTLKVYYRAALLSLPFMLWGSWIEGALVGSITFDILEVSQVSRKGEGENKTKNIRPFCPGYRTLPPKWKIVPTSVSQSPSKGLKKFNAANCTILSAKMMCFHLK